MERGGRARLGGRRALPLEVRAAGRERDRRRAAVRRGAARRVRGGAVDPAEPDELRRDHAGEQDGSARPAQGRRLRVLLQGRDGFHRRPGRRGRRRDVGDGVPVDRVQRHPRHGRALRRGAPVPGGRGRARQQLPDGPGALQPHDPRHQRPAQPVHRGQEALPGAGQAEAEGAGDQRRDDREHHGQRPERAARAAGRGRAGVDSALAGRSGTRSASRTWPRRAHRRRS